MKKKKQNDKQKLNEWSTKYPKHIFPYMQYSAQYLLLKKVYIYTYIYLYMYIYNKTNTHMGSVWSIWRKFELYSKNCKILAIWFNFFCFKFQLLFGITLNFLIHSFMLKILP